METPNFISSTLKVTASENIDISKDLEQKDPSLTIDDLLNEKKEKK